MAFDWSTAKRVSETSEPIITEESITGKERLPEGIAVSAKEGVVASPRARESFGDLESGKITRSIDDEMTEITASTTRKPEQKEYKVKTDVSDVIRKVIGEEGNYVNNPRDKGGPTKFGIALNFNKDVLTEMGIDPTAEGVKNMTFDQAVQIYKEQYWDKSGADELPEEVQFDYFTAYVNSPRRAVRAVQAAVGAKTDGVMGPNTLATLKEKAAEIGSEELGRAIKKEYVLSLAGTSDWDEFGNGWANRYLETDVFGEGKIDLNTMSKQKATKAMEEVFNNPEERLAVAEVENSLKSRG